MEYGGFMLELKRTIMFGDSDADENGEIKISSMMYHFQEIASAHADKLGAGFTELMEDDRIWVMTKLKFMVYEKLSAGIDYVLSTYPRQRKGVTFFRDYYISDNKGKVLTAAASHWCIINFTTRRIERTGLDFPGEYTDKAPFENGIEKIKLPDMMPVGEYVVSETDLDRNQHTNNCRYGDIVSNITGSNSCRQFIINFAHEARMGDTIYLYRGISGDSTVITGKLDDGTSVFQASVI